MGTQLRIAVQMDPLETINVAGDSTYALMLEAEARGHLLWHYQPDDLVWDEGQVKALARPVSVHRPTDRNSAHFHWLGEPEWLNFAEQVDVVLMRQDPPFDMAYITATHLLERAAEMGVLVVNNPASVRNAPEKLFVLGFADLMPPTLVTRSLEAAQEFRRRHGEVVVKPLYGNAGAAVFHVPAGDSNLPALVELFSKMWREPFMVQAFLPDVSKGDKRIVLIEGEPVGAINRMPKDGEIRSNLAAGGSAHATQLSPEELYICERIGPELKRLGLLFVGIDVIAGKLTEINVTSPTGIVAIDRFNGSNIPAIFWDRVQAQRS